MKRILALILVALITLSLFASCVAVDEGALQGEKGEQGVQGEQGEKGEKGDKGDKGDQGATGEKGDKGDKGDQGVAGAQGEKGDKGDQGVAGPQGAPGANGITPQLKIDDNNEWCVSYDNGTTWTSLGVKATGKDGAMEMVDPDNRLRVVLLVDGTYGIAGLSDTSWSNVNIPSQYNGIPVTQILPEAFKGCEINYLSLPTSLKKIGHEAFRGCNFEYLRGEEAMYEGAVVIPDGLEEIANYAFRECEGLRKIIIPDSVERIGAGAFEFCYDLSEIAIGDDSEISEIGMCAFHGTAIRSFKVPSKVTVIASDTFAGCQSLSSLTFPISLTKLVGGFTNCNSLNSIDYPGTQEQWEAIEKNPSWKGNRDSITVNCLGSVEEC